MAHTWQLHEWMDACSSHLNMNKLMAEMESGFSQLRFRVILMLRSYLLSKLDLLAIKTLCRNRFNPENIAQISSMSVQQLHGAGCLQRQRKITNLMNRLKLKSKQIIR